jgi:cytochrome P450
MARVEIEEADLKANQTLANTIQAMLRHPEARKRVLEAQKIIQPNAVIPEIDAAKPVTDAIEAMRKEMAEERAARQKEKEEELTARRVNDFKSSWERAKDTVRGLYTDLNEDGISAIEKMAEERGIADFEAAAALWRRDHPPATPQAPGGSGWAFFEDPQDNVKEFMEKQMASKGEDESGLARQVNSVLADIRGTKRAA